MRWSAPRGPPPRARRLSRPPGPALADFDVRLILANYRLAASRLDPWQPPPQWALTSPFFSITRSADELSVICDERDVPPGQEARTGIAALRLAKPPSQIRSASSLAALGAGRPGSACSSFHLRDRLHPHIAERLTDARGALEDAGHEVEDHNTPR